MSEETAIRYFMALAAGVVSVLAICACSLLVHLALRVWGVVA